MKNFIEELEWRGLIQDKTNQTDFEYFNDSLIVGYAGFDPTSDSLHIGNLVPIMLLTHLQRCGHKPIALIGGATGRVGDPSGKSNERIMLDSDIISTNMKSIKVQLSKFLRFDDSVTGALLLDNYSWIKEKLFLDFLNEIGTNISINYMFSKDSVKNRIDREGNGISYTEFCYQLFQGYDYLFLNRNYNCSLQLGGSDQWGNIITGLDLIKKIDKKSVHGLTAPLVKKADGSKFGKSEKGNIWLDSKKTTYKEFYNYWYSSSDEEAEKYMKIFTLLEKEKIEDVLIMHKSEPEKKILQLTLANYVTSFVHGEAALNFK